jgi:2'-5' RNA ligase
MSMYGGAPTRRLFVALPVDGRLRAQAAALPDLPEKTRRVAAADLHITLRFLGDVEQGRLADIDAALAAVRKKPFHVVVRGLGVFQAREQTVLYAAVESTRNLTDLCARVTERLTPLGFDFGQRPFVPHVTLARLPGRTNIDKYLKINDKYINLSWETADFYLMESGGGSTDGARYIPRARFPLIQ